MKRDLQLMEQLVKARRSGGGREETRLAYCAMVGAVALARAVNDDDLAVDLLTTVEAQLLELPPRASGGLPTIAETTIANAAKRSKPTAAAD